MESLLRGVSKVVNGYMGDALQILSMDSLFRGFSKFVRGYRAKDLLKGVAHFSN